MQNVDDFIEQLITERGITGLEPEVMGELKKDMKERLLEQIDRAAIMQLSDEKADELTQKLEDPNFTNDDMANFMEKSGVDLTQVALETMLQFRNLYLTQEG